MTNEAMNSRPLNSLLLATIAFVSSRAFAVEPDETIKWKLSDDGLELVAPTVIPNYMGIVYRIETE